MSKPILLQTDHLSIQRDGVPILTDINWTVRSGEHWVLLGANGSGKTSLLKALTGYMPPTTGEITVLGEIFGESDWRELRKRVGVVSSSISHLIHDEDLAAEVVIGGRNAMIGVWGRVPKEDVRRALRLMSLLRIRRLANRRWEVLSQGERQRVLIARALMADPALLILDEPCAGLDPVARERFLRDVRNLATKKTAPVLVFVTHHIEEILPEFRYLITLRQGQITYCGPLLRGLTPAVLDDVFGASIKLEKRAGRYYAGVSLPRKASR